MSVETNKLVNLGDAQVLYNDLRDRTEGNKDDLTAMTTALAAMGLVVYNGQFYINPDGNTLPA